MVTGILNGEERRKQKVFEEMIAGYSKIIKRHTFAYSRCSATTPPQGKIINSMRTTPEHILVKRLKTKIKRKC